jgi:PEP-CTERM motif
VKSRIILLALGVCLLGPSSLASANNVPLPPCCGGLSAGAISFPSTAFTYQGVQPDPPDCCTQDLAVNPNVPHTFELSYWPNWGESQADATWYVTVEAPEYSFDPTDITSAYLTGAGVAFSDWYNALYGGATEYGVGPDNYIVPVVPEPGSPGLLLLGLCFLVIIRCSHRVRI